MAQPEFHRPECFDGSTTDEIHERMMASLPDDIDDMPAGFPYDFTRPAAEEKSEFINYHLIRAVENALYHGIKNKRGKGKILITGKKQGDKIIFQVIDNGKGMTEEELNSLRKKMAGTDTGDEEKGFGVSNVNQRIKYYYGEEYGVFFESRENEGTNATIIIAAKNIQLPS